MKPALLRSESPQPRILSIPEVLQQLTAQGDPIPTGFSPLDRQLRGGGMRAGRILVLGGPPEAGKTTLMCQILNFLASQGHPVFCLFKDEGMEQAAVRASQQLGHSQELLERGDTATIERLSIQLQDSVFGFLDPDESGMSLEAAVLAVNTACPRPTDGGGRARVLALDSIQTIPTYADPDRNAETERGQITQFMDATRMVARLDNMLIVASSKVSRGFYQRKDPKERSSARASFLESSAIEYGADVALVIHPANDDGSSRCEFAKNRLRTGKSTFFFTSIDYANARVIEIDTAGAEDEASEKGHASVKKAEDAIVAALKANREGLLAGALLELAGKGVSRQAFFTGRAALLERHTIFSEADGRYVRFKLTLSDE